MNIDVLLEDVPMGLIPKMRKILETQIIWNALFGEKPHFNATVLAMVKEIFNPFKFYLWNLIRIFPMSEVHLTISDNGQDITIKSKTKAFLTGYIYKTSGLADTFETAESIRREVIHAIVTELYNIAKKNQIQTYTWDLLSGNPLVEFVAEMRDRYPKLKWIMLNSKILGKDLGDYVVNGIHIYIANFLPDRRVLISTSNCADSPFIFSPCCFQFEEINDNISPPGMIKMRYGTYASNEKSYEIVEIV